MEKGQFLRGLDLSTTVTSRMSAGLNRHYLTAEQHSSARPEAKLR